MIREENGDSRKSARQHLLESPTSRTKHDGVIGWKDLPDTSLELIVQYITFSERCRFFGTSKYLWNSKTIVDGRTKTLLLRPDEGKHYLLLKEKPNFFIRHHPHQTYNQRIRCMFQTVSPSVESLIVDEGIDDDCIQTIFFELQLFPNLKSLRMRSCEGLTDVGLQYLSQSRVAKCLENIDICYCNNTSYHGTFCLRNTNSLPNLQVIRRLPEWMDGHYETPFGIPGQGYELQINTYYADGSFTSNREELPNNGFISQLFKWDKNQDDFVGNKQQYIDFAAPDGWPQWTQYMFRPGVSLFRLDDEKDDHYDTNDDDDHNKSTTTTRSIIVAQYSHGLRPPPYRELMEKAKTMVKLGTSFHYSEIVEEQLTPTSTPTTTTRAGTIIASKMRIVPLTQLMPPIGLLQACHRSCKRMARVDPKSLEQLEEAMHEGLMDPANHE